MNIVEGALSNLNTRMTYEEITVLLNGLRKQLLWLKAEVAEYESGRPGSSIENGIRAAHTCAEMVIKLRRQADNLAVLIAAYEDSSDEYSHNVGGLDDQRRQSAQLPL